MTSKIEKIQANKLAPDMIGGIIQHIEEIPPKDLNWIESINVDKNNIWTIWIKPKASYYPTSIIKFNKVTKTRLLKGKLFEIEQKLESIYNKRS